MLLAFQGPPPFPSEILLSQSKPLPACSSSVVDKNSQPSTTGALLAFNSIPDRLDRCIRFWLGGSLLPQPRNLGSLVPSGSEPSHQHQGMPGSSPGHPTHRSTQGLGSPSAIRQHGSCSLDQSPRIQHKQETQHSRDQTAVAVLASPVDNQGKLHPRPTEHLGGLPLQGSLHPLRVVPCSRVVPSAASPSEPPGGPDCTSREREAPCVQVPLSPSQSSDPRCSNSGLEQVGLNLPVSSSRTHPRVPAKTSRICWPRHFRGARLTSRSLVA